MERDFYSNCEQDSYNILADSFSFSPARERTVVKIAFSMFAIQSSLVSHF